MSTKTALKAAKAAIDSKNWAEAKDQASTVLEKDSSNYFALLFLGRANNKLSLFDDAAKAYNDATKVKPEEAQAWLGLREMYDSMGPQKVAENTDVGLKLAEIYMKADDAHRSQSAIDKLVDHARKHGTPTQYAAALGTQLPSSPVYAYLEGRLPAPALTLVRIAEIHEGSETAQIKRLIDERRLRLGATLDTTTQNVKNEVYGASPLEGIYEEIINWTGDDEVRREYEERLLERCYEGLMVAPNGAKDKKREKVMKLAHDMVVIRHPYLLAWRIEMEWRSGLEVEVR